MAYGYDFLGKRDFETARVRQENNVIHNYGFLLELNVSTIWQSISLDLFRFEFENNMPKRRKKQLKVHV